MDIKKLVNCILYGFGFIVLLFLPLFSQYFVYIFWVGIEYLFFVNFSDSFFTKSQKKQLPNSDNPYNDFVVTTQPQQQQNINNQIVDNFQNIRQPTNFKNPQEQKPHSKPTGLYPCPYGCDEKFTNKKYILEHINKQHLG